MANVPWESHRESLRAVREAVFIREQNVPRALEWDGADATATHFLATDDAGRAIGCARLLPGGQIGRMAVLLEFRGRGLGRRLLDAAVAAAQHQGLTRVFLHAQVSAAGFYRKAGFVPVGDEYIEAGIPHRTMERDLPIPFESPGATAAPALKRSPQPVQRHTQPRQFRGEAECRRALADCLQMPRRRLVIFSQRLDHALFDAPAVVDAISRFARSTPQVRVRILITDTGPIVDRGHSLVELARRLDSRIEIRRAPEADAPAEESYVTWDAAGYLLIPDFQVYTAVLDPHDAVRAQRMTDGFTALWEKSAPDPELRTLKL
ncbi:MAG: GNAT family N-acetyltransferase [Pseudomonadota bacterium]